VEKPTQAGGIKWVQTKAGEPWAQKYESPSTHDWLVTTKYAATEGGLEQEVQDFVAKIQRSADPGFVVRRGGTIDAGIGKVEAWKVRSASTQIQALVVYREGGQLRAVGAHFAEERPNFGPVLGKYLDDLHAAGHIGKVAN
jgi:hypothetical protein